MNTTNKNKKYSVKFSKAREGDLAYLPPYARASFVDENGISDESGNMAFIVVDEQFGSEIEDLLELDSNVESYIGE